MSRVFVTLAFLSLTLMVTALVLGLGIGQLHPGADAQTLRWASVHRLVGIAAALAVILVNSIAVTYFVGTSRWTKEVAEMYQLPASLVRAAQQLKWRTFPWLLVGMLAVVGVSALGAASDPATGRAGTEYHLSGAVCAIGLVCFSYVQAWNSMHTNFHLIQQVMAAVQAIRRERGLDAAPE